MFRTAQRPPGEREAAVRFGSHSALKSDFLRGPKSAETGSGANSFDHLVSAGEQRRRDCKAERGGGLQIDDQLEFCRQLDRQVGGPGTFENGATRVEFVEFELK